MSWFDFLLGVALGLITERLIHHYKIYQKAKMRFNAMLIKDTMKDAMREMAMEDSWGNRKSPIKKRK